MSNQQTKFDKALQLHQSGMPQQAIAVYKELLQKDKNNPHLLFLVGTALSQIGQPKEGIVYLQKSADLYPNPITYNNIGTTFAKANKNREAIENFNKAIALVPSYAEAYSNRAAALRNLHQLEESLTSCNQAIQLDSTYADAFNNKGDTLFGLNQLDEAIVCYDKAISLKPDYAEAYSNRGIVFHELKRYGEALADHDKAIELKPEHADAHTNRGIVLQKLMRLDEALASYDRAIAIKPDCAGGYTNRGFVLQEMNRLDEALASYDKAIELKVSLDEAYWNKSLLLILLGRYHEGWELYEWRQIREDTKKHYYSFSQHAWRGVESIQDQTILIYGEQGFGDVIQFCRYVPLVKQLCAQVVLEVAKPLVGLMSTLNCSVTIIAKGDKLPEFDAFCPVMSLPLAFKTKVETIPADIPYLRSDQEKVVQWQKRLGSKSRFRVGLVWSGAKENTKLLNRRVALEQLLPMLQLPVEWHSLQKEYFYEDLAVLERHPEIQQHQSELEDFSDTAALIECLDLVITVDTAVAHLAGAMGKPVWIMVRFESDYRWMLDRNDSPWYPSATLFRQPNRGDWDSVLEKVRLDLVELVKKR